MQPFLDSTESLKNTSKAHSLTHNAQTEMHARLIIFFKES